VRFGLPSAVRGIPGVGCLIHWALTTPAIHTIRIAVLAITRCIWVNISQSCRLKFRNGGIMFEWRPVIQRLGEGFASRAAEHDENDRFVSVNWAEMKSEKLFSAMVPAELGGAGLPHSEMCALIRELARYCSSTALAFSMHQHLVAAAVWNYRHGNPGEKVLRKVADGETVLVSTGANDWLSSSGSLDPCEGGFRFSAKKGFASGSPAGDLLMTSGRYQDPKDGWQVLHFPLPLRSEGVRIEENWKAMGMRGS